MARLPLEGITVIDFSMNWAGPMAGRVLADMGADVIKIESCQKMDAPRYSWLAENEARERPWERGWFPTLNRNKRGITLDLSRPQGVALAKRLVNMADVVLENYSPRVMVNLGLDYPKLKLIKPDIIMISMSGYGQTGPYRNYIGYGVTLEPTAGLSELAGYPDGPPVVLDSLPSDPTAGFFAAGAVLAALRYRHRTGKGQYIDLSEMESVGTLIGAEILDYTMNKRVQTRRANRHPAMAPHNFYCCKGENKWIAIAVSSDEEWHSLCQVMGNPSWSKEKRFSDALSRQKNQDELDKHIEEWTLQNDNYELMLTLQRAGVSAVALFNGKELYFDPHLKERKYWQVADHPEVGKRPMVGMPFKLSKTPGCIRAPAPTLGQHNEEILGGLLGLSQEEIAQLAQENIIGNVPIPNIPPDITSIDIRLQVGVILGYDPDYLKQLGVA